MHELIEKIISQTGISHEQANGALAAIKSFVSEKFPMLSGPLESILGGNTAAVENNSTETPVNTGNLLSEAEEKLKGLFN